MYYQNIDMDVMFSRLYGIKLTRSEIIDIFSQQIYQFRSTVYHDINKYSHDIWEDIWETNNDNTSENDKDFLKNLSKLMDISDPFIATDIFMDFIYSNDNIAFFDSNWYVGIFVDNDEQVSEQKWNNFKDNLSANINNYSPSYHLFFEFLIEES